MNLGATSGRSVNGLLTETPGSLYNITRGYDPASLFTDPCGYGYGNWKPINYTSLQYPAAAGVIYTGCSVAPMGLPDGEIGVYWGFAPWGTGNPVATPLFSLPDDVTLVDPSWKTCSAKSYGVWDPPIKLTKESAMVPAAATLSQQLIATPRSPIPTLYGPATAMSSVEDPETDAPQLLPPIAPENPDRGPSTGDSSFSSSDPTDNTRPSVDPSSDDSAPDAPSVKLPSTHTHRPAQSIKGSASSLIATTVVNIQSPAPGPSPGPRLSVQPDNEDTGFALSLVAPIATPQSDTAGGHILGANPTYILLPGTTVLSDQSGRGIAGTSVKLHIPTQLFIGDSTIALPESTSPSEIFTVGGQVFTAKSNAIFMDREIITPGGRGKIVGGTQVSLGSSGLLNIGTSTILLGEDKVPPTAVTIGSKVLMPNPTASSIDGKLDISGGYGMTIDGTVAGLGFSGLLDAGSSAISLSAEQALPTAFPVGSEAFIPNPTALSIDGTTITAGGPGVTVFGTPIELQASGSLVIGNSTFAVIPTSSGLLDVGSSTISLSAEQALLTAFAVGSETFIPNPTALSIDGITITAGGPGITVAGTPIELQASGSLVIGNSTFAVIPTNRSTSPTNLVLEGQATSRGRNMFFGSVYIITICTILAAL